MNYKQMKLARYLLNQAGLADEKDGIVLQFTNNRTTHLSEMTKAETTALLTSLCDTRIGQAHQSQTRKRMINKILSMAHEMGWEKPDGKVDMKRLNAWCEKYSKQHTPLDKISDQELPSVVTVFEKVYLSFLKGI